MTKSRDAFRTISEVSDWLETPAHVLRFWESRFNQIKPLKRAGGRRYYRPNDLLLLGGIKQLLHEDGITIKGVQKILREKGVKHVCGLCVEPLDDKPAAPVADKRESVPVAGLSNKSAGSAPEIGSTMFKPTIAPEPAQAAPPTKPRLSFTAPRADSGAASTQKAAIVGKPSVARQKSDRMSALYSRLERLRDRVAADLG